MKQLFWPAVIISLATQTIVSAAKWGAYPSDSVIFWFSSGAHYVLMRLVVYMIVFGMLWLLASICLRSLFFAKAASVSKFKTFFVLVIITSLAELIISIAEWFYLPAYFTGGWFKGSFALFEAEWLKMFFLVSSVLLLIWMLITRSRPPLPE